MELYFLRHATAEPRGLLFPNDEARPLSAEGKIQARMDGKGMKRLKLDYDVILSSPYLRARTTAEIVADALDRKEALSYSDSLAPDGSSRAVIRELESLSPKQQSVLLVGHEPCFSKIISLLAGGDTTLDIRLRKGGLCKLSVDALRHGQCATMDFLLTPRQLAMIAKKLKR